MIGLRDTLNEYHLSRAETLLSQGRLRSASRHLTKVRNPGRRVSRAWRLKGRLLTVAGLPVAAVQCLFNAMRVSTGASQGVVLELAWCLYRARDYERASQVLERYLARNPGDRMAVTLLAHQYRAQGRFAKALDVLSTHRPKNVAGKYANTAPPQPKLAWRPEKAWIDALQHFGHTDEHWHDPTKMANDRDLRDDLLCFFDDLTRHARWKKALAHGVALALSSDASWLLPYARKAAPYLKLRPPATLPMFIARHGDATDKDLLLACLAEGGRTRVFAAASLISLGFEEFEEVLLEMRTRRPEEPVPTDVWSAAYALLGSQG